MKLAILLVLIALACSPSWSFQPPHLPFRFRKPSSSTESDDPWKKLLALINVEEVVTSVMTHAVKLGMTYLALKAANAVIQGALSSAVGLQHHNSSLPSSIAQYIHPNATLSSHELEIAAGMLAPEAVGEDWRSIGGMAAMQRHLMELLDHDDEQWAMRKERKEKLFTDIHSLLFFGPPGCGKSMLIKGLCRKLGLPLIQVTPSLLLRKYVGESSQLTRALFSFARKASPVVLFVDEADALLRERTADDHGVDRQLKTEFLQLWDQLVLEQADVLLVCATNRPQDLDGAVQRRFDRSFLLDLPGLESRADIFDKALAAVNKERGFDISFCARASDGFTSSDIANLCKAAVSALKRKNKARSKANLAEKPLSNKDMLGVLQSFMPSSWAARAYGSPSSASTPAAADIADISKTLEEDDDEDD